MYFLKKVQACVADVVYEDWFLQKNIYSWLNFIILVSKKLKVIGKQGVG